MGNREVQVSKNIQRTEEEKTNCLRKGQVPQLRKGKVINRQLCHTDCALQNEQGQVGIEQPHSLLCRGSDACPEKNMPLGISHLHL